MNELELLNNNILISYNDTEGQLETKSGIFIDTSYNPTKYAPVEGIVLKSSNKEVQEGDKIVFHYLTIINAKKEGRVFYERSKLGVVKTKAIIPIGSAFYVERGSNIIFLNRYILCRGILEDSVSNLDNVKRFKKNQFKVVYDGYRFKKGQIVATKPECDIPYVDNKIMGDTSVYRVSVDDICGIIEGTNIVPIVSELYV